MNIQIGHQIVYSEELMKALNLTGRMELDLEWTSESEKFYVHFIYDHGSVVFESDIDFNACPAQSDEHTGTVERVIRCNGNSTLARIEFKYYDFIAVVLKYRFALMLMQHNSAPAAPQVVEKAICE